MASAISSLLGFGPKRTAPATVPTDEIVPMALFDYTPTLKGYTLMWTFRFDEVLDADKLGNSLSQLFQMDGWRKLGGRIRLRPDGKAEIHIPRPFTAERPPIHFTKEQFDISITEHPEASKLPRSSGQTETFPTPRNFHSLAFGPGAPRCIDDFLYSDHPQYSLHVVTFTDATLVSINFNHATSDLPGLMAVIAAWQLVLAGKPEAVAPFMGFQDDIMSGLYSKPKEKSLLADKQLSMWGLIMFGLRLVFGSWWNPPGLSQVVCVPGKTIDALVQAAKEEAKQLEASGVTDSSFVSEGDVVTALANKTLAHSLPPNRPMTTLQAADPRNRCKGVFRQDAAYVGNAPCATFQFSNSHECVSRSIGELALECRRTIVSQLTEEQMKATAALARDAMVKSGNPGMFGESNAAFLVISNWSKAKFFEKMDFSPAIVKASKTIHPGRKAGHPVYYHSQSLEKGSFTTNVVTIVGRDQEKNFWMGGTLPASVWPVFLANLKQFA